MLILKYKLKEIANKYFMCFNNKRRVIKYGNEDPSIIVHVVVWILFMLVFMFLYNINLHELILENIMYQNKNL